MDFQTAMKRVRPGRRIPVWWPAYKPLVMATGDVIDVRAEAARVDHQRDHVWITMDTGNDLTVEVSVNTRSLKNAAIGEDPRVRLGVRTGEWQTLPPRGVRTLDGFDYRDIESAHNIFYEQWEREPLERAIIESAARCVRLEVWGMPYHRRTPGIHQVHSRRASCAVKSDTTGLDGGMRFYFGTPPGREELWMFKFCGQP